MNGLLIILALLLVGCASGDRGASERKPFVHRLNSGDVVRVTVFGHPDLSGDYRIGERFVLMPLSGAIRATNTTAPELEEQIARHLVEKGNLSDPHVSVEVLEHDGFIHIFGEVQRPGFYTYFGGMTLIDAVALAGGFRGRADQGRIQIKNDDETIDSARLETPLYPGDVVKVRERFF